MQHEMQLLLNNLSQLFGDSNLHTHSLGSPLNHYSGKQLNLHHLDHSDNTKNAEDS
jgi:hypothetical protein